MTTAPERIWAWAWQTVPMGQWGITPSPSSVEYIRADIAAVQPVPEALHRSFQDAFDGRPMPPMGDELMIAGLSVDDARFVAVQLAQNGLTLTAQPDPRDEVIARLVEALGHAQYGLSWAVRYFKDQDVTKDDPCPPCTRGLSATIAALAAAKAVRR